MGVLGSAEIVKALDEGDLTIDPRPLPGPGEPGTPYDACSVKLRLDNFLLVPRPNLKLNFDLSRPGNLSDTIENVTDRVELADTGYLLESGKFLLGQTAERVGFPSKTRYLAGRIEGRSSFARTGLLVHFTAPTLHAGWTGNITLELMNLGPLDLVLRPGLPICQLIVETVTGEVTAVPEPQFAGQQSPSGADRPRGNGSR